MYEKHSEFSEPSNVDARIWRYLDIWKFLSLLQRGSLHFARGDKFEDPYEGMLTDYIANNIKTSNPHNQVFEMWCRHHTNTRYDTYLSCWYLSEDESAALWNGTSLAIQSTFKSLVEAVSNVKEPVYIGMIKYGDEHLRGNAMPNGFAFWMWKRKNFEHEKELRALIWRPRNLGIGCLVSNGTNWQVAAYPPEDSNTQEGLMMPVDLPALVHKVVLSPQSPAWQPEIVNNLVTKYGYRFPVSKSKLYELSYA